MEKYMENPIIASIRLLPNGRGYQYEGGIRAGIKSLLEETYYPHYTVKKKRHGKKRARKASTKKQGITIDNQLKKYVEGGKAPTNNLAHGIRVYLEDRIGHTIVGAQVPILIQVFGTERITQADLISQDGQGRLWLWEVKSGYNQRQRQGELRGLPGIPNREHEHWELQRHFTHLGAIQQGLPIYKSAVLNVYEENDMIVVNKRTVPRWCSLLLPNQ
jgi:hypothetical protein